MSSDRHIIHNIKGMAAITTLLPFLCFFIGVHAVADNVAGTPDTTAVLLDEVVVSHKASNSDGKYRGGVYHFYSAARIDGLRTFGEADFINAIKNSGITTAVSDYAAGFSIDGMNPSHTLFSVNGVQIFFPYRFGGIFSVFPTSHFAGANFEPALHDASFPDALGGRLNVYSRFAIPQKARAQLNLGLISSSLSFGIPIGDKLSINANARLSYINSFYSKLLAGNTSETLYDFNDFNLSAVYTPDDSNNITLEAYTGNDKLSYNDGNYGLAMGLRWRNTLISALWRHTAEKFSATHKIYYTRFGNTLNVDMAGNGIDMLSSIDKKGLAGDWFLYTHGIKTGYTLDFLTISPAAIDNQNNFWKNDINTDGGQVALHARIYVNKELELRGWFILNAGVSASVWQRRHNRAIVSIDPRVTLSRKFGNSTVSLHVGTYAQYLHHLGFSEIGLASNYFIGADNTVPVQREISFNPDFTWQISNVLHLHISPYYKLLRGQTEYEGQLLEMLETGYDHTDYIIVGCGHNIGINAELGFDTGSLNGTLTYGFGSTKRRSPQYDYTYQSIHDPGHRLTANATYVFNRHWNIALSMHVASGRPYTPVKSMYLIGKNLIFEYADKNSGRFPLYHRLDLSGNYKFEATVASQKIGVTLNASIINAYGNKNIELQYFRIDPENGDIFLRKVSSLYRFMPSLGVTFEY